MANAKKCDRWGKFYTEQKDVKFCFVTDPYGKENYLRFECTRASERIRVDLCPECVDELIQYFKDGWRKSDS